VPVCQRHDVRYSVAVEYRAVDSIHGHGLTAWQTHVVNADETSVQLKLSSLLNYQVIVKSQTSVGFNMSLRAEPLYISTDSM